MSTMLFGRQSTNASGWIVQAQPTREQLSPVFLASYFLCVLGVLRLRSSSTAENAEDAEEKKRSK
jgi:hypothetical protein